MLGRLEMSVKDCITKYKALSDKIFAKWLIGDDAIQKGRIGFTGARYDSSIVETVFQQLVEQELGDKHAPLLNERGRCKVCVVASYYSRRRPVILSRLLFD
jgi:hypothetical protein